MTWATFTRASAVAAALFAVAALSPAAALNVQPMALDMVAMGSNSRGTIQIVNDSAKPLPVDVSFKKLDIGPDGKTTELPAKDEFLIFPPQAVVAPGATQSFRIQWVGAPDIKKSETYMVSVNQLPVKMKAGESGVQMVFSFGVIVNVAPAGGRSALRVLKAEGGASDDKIKGVAVTVENPSAMYAYFSDAKLTLESGGWKKTFAPGDLRDQVGYAVVLPGKTRRIIVPVEGAPAGPVQATIDYKPKTAK